MKFALLYQYDPGATGPSHEEVQDWLTFDKQVRDAGVFVYEAGFHDAREARTVRVRDGAAAAADGAPERPGDVAAGLYVIDVPGLDAAAGWAERVPTARYGTVEIRRLLEFDA